MHAMGQETLAGSSAPVDLVQRTSADLALTVSAVTGALSVWIETSDSSEGPWQRVAAFATTTSAESQRITVPGCSRYLRASWSGATACTFSVAGAAVLVYCTPADLRGNALHAKVFAQFSDTEVDEIARKQTAIANSYLRQNPNVTLPLLRWGDDLRSIVCELVAYQLMKLRGFNPESSDQIIVDAKNDAFKWLAMVAAGKVTPDDMVDSTQSEPAPLDDMTAQAFSRPPRGL